MQIVRSDGSLVGTIDRVRACAAVHTGAIYLHQGRPYRVAELDLEDNVATVVDSDGEQYTQARSSIDISVVASDDRTHLGAVEAHVGAVEVVSQVTGYQLREVGTRRILGNESLDLPPSTLRTRAFWYVVPPSVIELAGVEPAQVPGALHALEHAAIGMLPLFAICDRWDVGGVSTAWHAGAGGPTVFIYDAHPGGSGVAELGFAENERHLAATLEAIRGCTCSEGCPSCVQSPKCGNGNEPLDKAGAVALLRAMLGQD